MTTYRPGSFFLTAISGPTGFAVGLGQALAGAPSRYSHAGIIVDLSGTTIEAEPGGARYGHVADYAGRPLLISDGPVRTWLAGDVGLDGCASCQFGQHDACAGTYVKGSDWRDCQCRHDSEADVRARVVTEARKLIGVPYSPLDYAALAALHLHLPSGWIRRRVQRSGRLICSQLVDLCYQRASIHLFDDGRLPGDVMPSDLAAWAEDQEQAQQVAA